MRSLKIKRPCSYHLELRKLKQLFIFRQFNTLPLCTITFLKNAKIKNMFLEQMKNKTLSELNTLEHVHNFNSLLKLLLNKLTHIDVPARFI